ncbi:uncharacterized protein LOC34624487 [Cyclospora cayetanensis]|uniref:Uncharacterized protein LOC34624487 n=1 Tax=Cyclospora cayetanensis TaxID=88456 RepID=A0A6P6S063_9EIME|nr:uncharacterized protein LOC34624487 [Cyclospora cayetanensis]
MAIREHLYLALHGAMAIFRGRQRLLDPWISAGAVSTQGLEQLASSAKPQQPASTAPADAIIEQRKQAFLRGPLVPYDFNWISAVRASRAMRAAVACRSLQQQKQQQKQEDQQWVEEWSMHARELLQKLQYCEFLKPSFLLARFALRPLEGLLEQLAAMQLQQPKEGSRAAAATAAPADTCRRGLRAKEQLAINLASSRFRQAVAKATIIPELVIPADRLSGPSAGVFRRLFKEDRSGGVRVPQEGSNYETVLALLQSLNPGSSKRATFQQHAPFADDLAAQWVCLRSNSTSKPQQTLVLQQLLQLLQQKQQLAARCGYTCWAEMRIKRQTAEGSSWREVPRMLRSIGQAAANRAPPQLRDELRKQQQQQQQQGQQQGRLSVDQWLAAALRAYGRGVRDLEVAAWFPESIAVQRAPLLLAEAYGLTLQPLLKKPWKGFGRCVVYSLSLNMPQASELGARRPPCRYVSGVGASWRACMHAGRSAASPT